LAGQDITEGLPLNVGNPGTSGFWTNNAEDYDVAFGGIPFFIAPTDQNPYQRETAPYRKDQFDNSREPGEQSLTGWWLRSQSSFHGGAGIKFFDPSAGESIGYRYFDSQGVNPWVKGQVTLLKDTSNVHTITTEVNEEDPTKKAEQHIRSIRYSNTNAILLHDGYDIDRIDADGTLIHWIDYNSGSDDPVFALCDDGLYGYFVTNDTVSGKLEFNRKLLSDGAGVAPTARFTTPGLTITSAEMEFVKDRIVMCVNNAVYEIATNATTLPSAIYTNPNTNYMYTSITASGPAIYTAGHSGIYSTIQKYTLGTNGAMPTLSQASVAAELPPGEIIHKIFYYLGYMLIGTSKGLRVANVNDQDGSLEYGPLVFESTQPVYDIACRDRFAWATTGVGSNAGLTRVDLSQLIEGEPLRFAYSTDLDGIQTTLNPTTAVGFVGTTNRLAFCSANNGTADGKAYIESASTLVTSGYLQTGAVRYGTLEPKNFKFVRARGVFTYGAMDIQTVEENGNVNNVISYNSAVGTPEAATTSPETPQEFLSYRFTLSRSASDTSQGPVFKGFQAKALPATKRQRLIQFPVWCFDVEKDRYNVTTGYEGRAWERIQILEAIEAEGDIVNVQDFTTGERVQAIIEQIQFSRKTPPSGNFSGFGGLLTVTVRTVL
jgi:hypothetical protein